MTEAPPDIPSEARQGSSPRSEEGHKAACSASDVNLPQSAASEKTGEVSSSAAGFTAHLQEGGRGQPRGFLGWSWSGFPRRRMLLAVVLWMESAWAAAFLVWTVVLWAELPRNVESTGFDQDASIRLIRSTDVPRMGLWLALVLLVTIVLFISALSWWHAYSRPTGQGPSNLAAGTAWAQPLLAVLILESALAVQYAIALYGPVGVTTPTASKALLASIAVVVALVMLVLVGGWSKPRLGALLSLIVIAGLVVAPLLLVDGYWGYSQRFSVLGALPTGRTSFVGGLSCVAPGPCLAEGWNPGGLVRSRYDAVIAIENSSSVWEAASPVPAPGRIGLNGPLGGYRASISCPTPRVCVALGLWVPRDLLYSTPGKVTVPLWRSRDGGTHWAMSFIKMPSSAGLPLAQLACMTALTCVASDGSTVVETSDGGSIWSTVSQLPVPKQLQPGAALDCPTSRSCIVFSSTIQEVGSPRSRSQVHIVEDITTDGGANWDSFHAPGAMSFPPSALGCWSSSSCLLQTEELGSGADLYRTDDGGSHWKLLRAQVGGVGLSSIVCPAVRLCFAIANGTIVRTRDGGASWKILLSNGGPTSAVALSCSSALDCVAGGTVASNSGGQATLWSTRSAGATWVGQPFPQVNLPEDTHPCFFPLCP